MTALLADVEERRDDATELHQRLKETGDPAAQEALVRTTRGSSADSPPATAPAKTA